MRKSGKQQAEEEQLEMQHLETNVANAKKEQALQGDLDGLHGSHRNLEQLRKTMSSISVSVPADADGAWDYVVENFNKSAANIARAGFALLQLKEQVGHGSFKPAIEERDIPYRMASEAMRIAKFLAVQPPSKVRALVHLGSTKLVELARLPEESLQKLEETDEISGMTLDAIDRMSTRELQQEVRKLREELVTEKETAERILETKSQQINELERQVHTKPTADQKRQQAEEQEKQLIQDVQMTVLTARSGLAGIQSLLQGLAPQRKTMPGLEDSIVSEMGCISAQLDRIFAEFGIDLPVHSPLNTPFGGSFDEFEGEDIDGVVEHVETH